MSHDPLFKTVPIHWPKPSPENDRLYHPINPESPSIKELAQSIRKFGLREPIVVTQDGYILSGHRRFAACQVAGLEEITIRVEPLNRADDIDLFVRLLREYNRQREKDHGERMREELVYSDPHQAYESLIEYRRKEASVAASPLKIEGVKKRRRISKAKLPFLRAIVKIVYAFRSFWPISVRQIHYQLLNDPPLKHASKADSRYANNEKSYKSLIELLARARLTGKVPMEAIGDETRPIKVWNVWKTTGQYLGREIDHFLKGYWRDLMQSQPNHVEIVAEKNTIAPIVNQVAMGYCIPVTTGRGYSSLPPRHAMAQRFVASGKSKLILIVVSDFDPEGEDIAHSFAQSMRDDFGISNLHPMKAALTHEQVSELALPENNLEAKPSSSRYSKFVERYGTNVWELEALEPDQLQQLLREVIDSVIDVDLFNAEIQSEEHDSGFLESVRKQVKHALSDLDVDE